MGKRNTFMRGPAQPTYPVDPLCNAAQHLALTARRYLHGRASKRDVDEAISFWVASPPSETPDGKET